MIFTSYFDEADTHGPAPTVIMAAFLGHAFQWPRFHKKLSKLQKRDGFTIFHAKDFKARAKEFSGWSEAKCTRLVKDLTRVVRLTLDEGMVIALERDRYLNEYRAPPIPKKMNLDSQYGVCFRACLAHQIGVMGERQFQDRLHVVIERGHPNVFDCERIFNDIKTRLLRRGVNVLSSFTVEKKETCPPLMMSDFLAAFYSMMRANVATGAPHYKDITAPPPSNEGTLTFLELNGDSLRDIKKNFERERQRDIEAWRARKEAKKTLSSASAK